MLKSSLLKIVPKVQKKLYIYNIYSTKSAAKHKNPCTMVASARQETRDIAPLYLQKSQCKSSMSQCRSGKITHHCRAYEIIHQDRTGTRSRRQRRDFSPLAAHRCRLPTRQPHHAQNQDPPPARGEIPLREIRYRGGM